MQPMGTRTCLRYSRIVYAPTSVRSLVLDSVCIRYADGTEASRRCRIGDGITLSTRSVMKIRTLVIHQPSISILAILTTGERIKARGSAFSRG